MEKADALKSKLQAINLDDKVIENTLKNKSLVQRFSVVLEGTGVKEASKAKGEQKLNSIGNLIYSVATKLVSDYHDKLIVDCIMNDKIKNQMQLDAAIAFVKKLTKDAKVNVKEFEESSGVGIETTEKEILDFVAKIFEEHKVQLLETGESYIGKVIIHRAREALPWADGKIMMNEINRLKGEVFSGVKKGEKKKKVKEPKKPVEAEEKEENEEKDMKYEKVGESKVGRDIESAHNSEALMKKFRDHTDGGKCYTRFPPEPNGYLHIGHAKAMRFSFTVAKERGGGTYLRYDDTNPEKESKEYIDSILDSLRWLGYEPMKITYSSDYFDELYRLAVELINKGKAYICFQVKQDVAKYRAEKKDSPYRNTSIEENLRLFDRMRRGIYEENHCCLRMKIDMQSPNPCMRDPVAYRIKYTEHPHGGDKWCVYPTYDYTHCIVDSLEWITYSLCSLEFEIRRDSYYWLLEALDLYRPQVWEFSRLNLTYTLLSKRKIDRLVKEKIVNGWDDPRLGSVNGLRRRGFTASAINNFCDEIGVTRRSNENFTQIQFLEHHVRKELDVCAPRTFMVLDPIKVVLTNFDDKEEEDVEVPIFPNDKTKGNQIYKLCKNIFIDQSDFKDAEPIKGFWGLCRKQVVCLKYAHHIELEEVVYDSNNKVDHIKAKLIKNYEHKVKGYIHWISEKYSFNAEVRLYDNIFNVEDPNTIDDWIEHAKTQESIVIKGNAKGWKKIQNAKEFDHFQFERLGYFVVDKDSTKKKLVFNRTVGLVESKAKKALQ